MESSVFLDVSHYIAWLRLASCWNPEGRWSRRPGMSFHSHVSMHAGCTRHGAVLWKSAWPTVSVSSIAGIFSFIKKSVFSALEQCLLCEVVVSEVTLVVFPLHSCLVLREAATHCWEEVPGTAVAKLCVLHGSDFFCLFFFSKEK